MRADPEPDETAGLLDGERAVAQPNPHGPEPSDLLEVQRGEVRVAFEKFVVAVGKLANRLRQELVGGPEAPAGEMPQTSRR